MIELKICKHPECDNYLKYTPATHNKRFCRRKCVARYHNETNKVRRWINIGLTFRTMCLKSNMKPSLIKYYWDKIYKENQPVTYSMSPEIRIQDERYLLENDRFYLPESMRIGAVINEGITIKEYAEKFGI